MQHQNRNPVRLATLLYINAVPMPHIQHALIERLDRRVKIFNCAFWA
jgi:hypothetical protein